MEIELLSLSCSVYVKWDRDGFPCPAVPSKRSGFEKIRY